MFFFSSLEQFSINRFIPIFLGSFDFSITDLIILVILLFFSGVLVLCATSPSGGSTGSSSSGTNGPKKPIREGDFTQTEAYKLTSSVATGAAGAIIASNVLEAKATTVAKPATIYNTFIKAAPLSLKSACVLAGGFFAGCTVLSGAIIHTGGRVNTPDAVPSSTPDVVPSVFEFTCWDHFVYLFSHP
jgi:hypothetical protein